MGLKKFLKKARRAVGLPPITLGNVAKLGVAAGIGGPAGLGAAVLKSKLKSSAIGGIKRMIKSKSDRAALQRAAKLSPPKVVGISSAVAMPGGAPLRGEKPATLPGMGTVLRQQHRTRVRRKTAAAKPKPKSNGKRKAPTGGKDFKALSASWKAAGKPGKWIDWVKSH